MDPRLRPFVGRWRIREMQAWDEHYIDLVVPGYIEIEPGCQGSFQFGTVSGDIDGALRRIGDVTFFEWSWWGQSDMDDGCGRGWAQVQGDKLIGRIFIHGSDHSSFVAERSGEMRTPRVLKVRSRAKSS